MSSRPLSDPKVPRHPMRVVMRRTGLSPDLLRAWEKRYEVVRPARSESGRRLYSDADIERLRLLYRATLAGRSIGQVAGLSAVQLDALVREDAEAEAAGNGAAPSAAPPAAPRAPIAPSPADYLDDCVRSIERLDALAVESILRRAVVALPADVLLDALVAPLLERVGARWRDGTLRPVHGHLASAVLRRVLDRVIETATSPSAAPGLVAATPAGQRHEFGALIAAAAAAAEGWRVTYLGADLPAEDIAEAAIQTRARAVALSVVYPAGDPAVRHELKRLRALLPDRVALLVGGGASSGYRAALDGSGAVMLGDLAALRAWLQARRPHRR